MISSPFKNPKYTKKARYILAYTKQISYFYEWVQLYIRLVRRE